MENNNDIDNKNDTKLSTSNTSVVAETVEKPKKQNELQLINNSITVYYERKSMENEDLCSKLEELNQRIVKTDISVKILSAKVHQSKI